MASRLVLRVGNEQCMVGSLDSSLLLVHIWSLTRRWSLMQVRFNALCAGIVIVVLCVMSTFSINMHLRYPKMAKFGL